MNRALGVILVVLVVLAAVATWLVRSGRMPG
jgi:hypothetical protein